METFRDGVVIVIALCQKERKMKLFLVRNVVVLLSLRFSYNRFYKQKKQNKHNLSLIMSTKEKENRMKKQILNQYPRQYQK